MILRQAILGTEYDQAKVPPHNGNDRRPPLVVQKPLCFHPYQTKYKTRGRNGVRARYDAELSPFISIVGHPCRPVISGMKILVASRSFEKDLSHCLSLESWRSLWLFPGSFRAFPWKLL